MQTDDFQPRTRVVYREGGLSLIGELAQSLGFTRTLVVADRGLQAAGLVDRATEGLRASGIVPFGFHEFEVNPDSEMVERGRRLAADLRIDSFVALGGGSSLDCAKGINFVLTNGGTMKDYKGYGKTTQSLLPMIGVPTTAGTGSEAQSYAIISDPITHEKMACGDPGAAFRIALLDPVLTITQPQAVTATAGYDAISHAVESFVTTKRSSLSDAFSAEAWQLLHANYEHVLEHPDDVRARGAMLVGANRAGAAIELSMLGATHACANPLTAGYGTVHGDAIAIMLPHVVRWNAGAVADRYAELLRLAGLDAGPHPGETLALRLEALRAAANLPSRLRDAGVTVEGLDALALEASKQWTGTFNPRPFDAHAALELYKRAL